MNDPREVLRKSYRRIIWPSLAANGAGAILATAYSALTFRVSQELGTQFIALSLAVAALVIVFNGFVSLRSLRTQRALLAADEEPSPALLQTAIREVMAFPDRIFFLSLAGWAIAVTGI